MGKHNRFSPLVDYVCTDQEPGAPDWYTNIKNTIRILCMMPVVLFMVCIFSLPVNAAEMSVELLNEASEASGEVSEADDVTDDGVGEPSLLSPSVSSGDIIVPAGYRSVMTPDGTVYYISGLAEDPDASETINNFPLYDSYEEFMESPLYVTRYENEVLKKLEFCQYAFAIVIALLFLLIFKKK